MTTNRPDGSSRPDAGDDSRITLTFVAAPGATEIPFSVRARRLLRYALRQLHMRCVKIAGRIEGPPYPIIGEAPDSPQTAPAPQESN